MSHLMTALAMKQEGLKPTTKIVLYWIADHHNGETGKCVPSHRRLSKLCGISRQSVINHIQILEEKGLIKSEQRVRENGSGTSNSYLLTLSEVVNNLDTPCTKSVHPRVKKDDTPNLGTNNLGIEPKIFGDQGFQDFWERYPRKIGKGNARKAFQSAIKKVDLSKILNSVDDFALLADSREQKFIPHPATWLNQERWDDEIHNEDKKQTTTDYLNNLFSEPKDIKRIGK